MSFSRRHFIRLAAAASSSALLASPRAGMSFRALRPDPAPRPEQALRAGSGGGLRLSHHLQALGFRIPPCICTSATEAKIMRRPATVRHPKGSPRKATPRSTATKGFR